MRLPREISGPELVKGLHEFGYRVTRQKGSHIRLTCDFPVQHHITIPNHQSLRIGTLSAVISDVAMHLRIPRQELINRLFNVGRL